MKNILLVLFLNTFGQEKDLIENTNLLKDTVANKLEFILEKDIFPNRDNNFCVATDKILKIYNIGEKPPDISGNNPHTPSGEPEIGSGNISTSFEKK